MRGGESLPHSAAMNNALSKDGVVPYQAWWGLAVCGLLMGIVIAFAPYHQFEILPRRSAFDYPWKLSDPTFWTRFSAWSLYALHQVAMWYLIYAAQSKQPKYIAGLHSFNVQALALNLLFIGLHI